MNRFLTAFVVVLLVIGAGVAAGGENNIARRVSVRLYHVDGADHPNQHRALETARSILRGAGIDVDWHDCDSIGHATEACRVPLAPGEFVVRFVRHSPESKLDGPYELGNALVDGARGTLATVYTDRVAAVAQITGADAQPLLGRVIAHEIGHLLLGARDHAASGLMRGNWSRGELVHQRVEDWMFAPADIADIDNRH